MSIFVHKQSLMAKNNRSYCRLTVSSLVSYRWKGENVSTTEVSDVLGLLDFIQEANVYGVTIPGLWNLNVAL